MNTEHLVARRAKTGRSPTWRAFDLMSHSCSLLWAGRGLEELSTKHSSLYAPVFNTELLGVIRQSPSSGKEAEHGLMPNY